VKYILEEEFTKPLQAVFERIVIPEEAYQEVGLALRLSHEDKKHTRTEHLARFGAEIEKYQTRIERVYEDYLDDLIPKSLYERKFEEFRKAQKSLQNKRINIEQVEDDYFSKVSYLLSIAKQAHTLFEKAGFEQKRSLVNLVLSNLQLDGGLLLWELKNPFDTLAFCIDNNNWLGR
jgi:hypothetical protein